MRIEFYEDQPLRRDTLLQKCRCHGPGTRTQFDDRAFGMDIDIPRHHAREEATRRRDSTRRLRVLDPSLEEARFIGKLLFQRGFSVSRGSLQLLTQTQQSLGRSNRRVA